MARTPSVWFSSPGVGECNLADRRRIFGLGEGFCCATLFPKWDRWRVWRIRILQVASCRIDEASNQLGVVARVKLGLVRHNCGRIVE